MKAIITLQIDIDPGQEEPAGFREFFQRELEALWQEKELDGPIEGTTASVTYGQARVEFDPPHKFAPTSWQVGDITCIAKLTDGEAYEWLADNQRHIQDGVVSAGWDVIKSLLEFDGIALKGEDEEEEEDELYGFDRLERAVKRLDATMTKHGVNCEEQGNG